MNSKKLLFTTLSLLSIIGYGVFVFAAPPGTGGYNPGETLDPECTPGDLLPNPCIVKPSLTTADNGLTATGSNVQLGGVLLNDTTIATNGREFVVQGTNSKLVSGADPLGLFPLIGEAYPGIGISTDGTLTGGVKSYIGSLINPSNSKSLTVLGNFDIANGIQAAMVAEDNELNIYSSDGVSGSSNVSLSPGSLSLYSNGGIDIYADNYIKFGNFGSSRDDSGTNFPTNFLYTDGSGNLQSAPTSLLGGGGSSLSSQDEGTLLTSTTTGYNFIGAGVTATESGGLVTVNIPGGAGSGLTLQTNGVTNTNQSLLNLVAGTNVSLADDGSGNITINASGGGGGADGSIYLNNGTLTGNRVLNGGGNSLTFSNISDFTSFTNNTQVFLSQKVDPGNSKTYLSGMILRPEAGVQNGVVLVEQNVTDNVEVGISIDADQGIGFRSGAIGSGLPDYFFPRTDGAASQVLTTDGAGQLSWQNAGGGGTNIYNSNGTLTGNRTLDANGNNLTFSNLDQMFLTTQSGNVGIIMSDKGSGYGTILSQGQELISGNNHRSQIATDIGDGAYDSDFDDLHLGLADISAIANNGAAIEVNATTGVRFRFRNGGVMSNYFFPRTDGTSSQILSTDGSGQLGWTTVATSPITVQNGTSLFSTGLSSSGSGSSAIHAVFLGDLSGDNATSADHSIFIGNGAGAIASNANHSIFLGRYTGSVATNAYYSNFFGYNAGSSATNAYGSNFFGQSAGYQASAANNSNFLGIAAGSEATNAAYSNFLGNGAGSEASNAFRSNFLGDYTGSEAANASQSNFIGDGAGYRAINAANSIFIGRSAGSYDSVNNTINSDDFSILIGNNTITNGFSNSIALGSHATNTANNQFMIGSTTRPIDQTKIIGSLGTECTITTGTGMACTSDERLKTNITDLNSDTLTKLQNVRTVSYNWLQNPNSPTQIGFLAQNLEQYFPEMVMTDATGKKQVYYSQMTPILVEAIRAMNLNITQLSDMTRTNTWRDSLIAWFESTSNGINNLFAKRVHVEQLCVGSVGNETCLTKDQVDNILNSTNTTLYVPPVIITPPTNDPGVNTETDDTSIDPGTDIESVPPTENTPPSDQPSTPPVDIPTE